VSAAIDVRKHSLQIVREQLDEAIAAKKCHSCGCLQQTVDALGGTEVGGVLASSLDAARAVFVAKKYDCLGCAICYPAIAANAFADAYPAAAATLDLCPTEAPIAREGWPPLPGDYQVARFGAPVAVCTLIDTALVSTLMAAAPDALAIVGTMHTENLGIERVITNVLANPNVRRLVLCGHDTEQAVGHLPGQAMQSLVENGIDDAGRIRGAKGKRPMLKNVTPEEVAAFRQQIEIVTAIGETNVKRIVDLVMRAGTSAPGPFEGAPSPGRVERVAVGEPKRLVSDPAGYFVVYPDARRGLLSVEHFTNAGVITCVLEGNTPAALYGAIAHRGLVSRLDHAAYLGRELARAERSLETGEAYVQDRAAGALRDELEDAPAKESCDCSHPCGTGGK
jgi:tetrahydromethanopterin S-methyltransferase subunit A